MMIRIFTFLFLLCVNMILSNVLGLVLDKLDLSIFF